jgi:hypothetical protein
MKLADRVVQCRKSLTVQNPTSGREVRLNGAEGCAEHVAGCSLRFVLSDDLTRLCADLAYSKGARNVACADLLHIPAETLWIEWCNAPWRSALQHYGFGIETQGAQAGGGRRGALIRCSPNGRRGTVRTFWTVGSEFEVLASSMEAFFDFDTPQGEEPEPPDPPQGTSLRVYDGERKSEDVLARCFRFRYERTWAEYYGSAGLSRLEDEAVTRHVLGTIAIDIPLLLAFLLLLASRTSLPRNVQNLERLNRARRKDGKVSLLDHIEVRSPVLPEYLPYHHSDPHGIRRAPRLHHVRGHLVRRGSSLFWRVPHLRGSARSGVLRTRTVTWTFDNPAARQAASGVLAQAAQLSRPTSD